MSRRYEDDRDSGRRRGEDAAPRFGGGGGGGRDEAIEGAVEAGEVRVEGRSRVRSRTRSRRRASRSRVRSRVRSRSRPRRSRTDDRARRAARPTGGGDEEGRGTRSLIRTRIGGAISVTTPTFRGGRAVRGAARVNRRNSRERTRGAARLVAGRFGGHDESNLY